MSRDQKAILGFNTPSSNPPVGGVRDTMSREEGGVVDGMSGNWF